MRVLSNNNKRKSSNRGSKPSSLLESVQDKHPKVYGAFDQLSRIGRTIGNKIDSDLNLRMNQQYIQSKYNLDCADHICVKRLVIHYDFSHICIVSLEEFAKGQPIFTVNSPIKYPKEVVMLRALSRLGEEKYHLITNNCEHFVRWCRSGSAIDL